VNLSTIDQQAIPQVRVTSYDYVNFLWVERIVLAAAGLSATQVFLDCCLYGRNSHGVFRSDKLKVNAYLIVRLRKVIHHHALQAKDSGVLW
jgi:hypothetical protein